MASFEFITYSKTRNSTIGTIYYCLFVSLFHNPSSLILSFVFLMEKINQKSCQLQLTIKWYLSFSARVYTDQQKTFIKCPNYSQIFKYLRDICAHHRINIVWRKEKNLMRWQLTHTAMVRAFDNFDNTEIEIDPIWMFFFMDFM